ncbi:MOSC domain-containing protein [Yoonia sp.]|uniref:MOSC domain-containing protein n=1 Tax=Yoonia sp. TaxID=2212373 RepID=UPI0035C829E9
MLTAELRRNLVIAGLNPLALRKGQWRVGAVVLDIHGPCPPCSRMEKLLGSEGIQCNARARRMVRQRRDQRANSSGR